MFRGVDTRLMICVLFQNRVHLHARGRVTLPFYRIISASVKTRHVGGNVKPPPSKICYLLDYRGFTPRRSNPSLIPGVIEHVPYPFPLLGTNVGMPYIQQKHHPTLIVGIVPGLVNVRIVQHDCGPLVPLAYLIGDAYPRQWPIMTTNGAAIGVDVVVPRDHEGQVYAQSQVHRSGMRHDRRLGMQRRKEGETKRRAEEGTVLLEVVHDGRSLRTSIAKCIAPFPVLHARMPIPRPDVEGRVRIVVVFPTPGRYVVIRLERPFPRRVVVGGGPKSEYGLEVFRFNVVVAFLDTRHDR
jgi:hypothetical protein